jgi:hypothetical protein
MILSAVVEWIGHDRFVGDIHNFILYIDIDIDAGITFYAPYYHYPHHSQA